MLLRQNIATTLSIPVLLNIGENEDCPEYKEVSLPFFSQNDLQRIAELIKTYETSKNTGTNARSGGGKLKSELEKIEYFRTGLMEHLSRVRDILTPRESVPRKTLSEAILETQRVTLESLAAGYQKLNIKALRPLAEAIMGDVQADYTPEELPLKLAEYQVYGRCL